MESFSPNLEPHRDLILMTRWPPQRQPGVIFAALHDKTDLDARQWLARTEYLLSINFNRCCRASSVPQGIRAPWSHLCPFSTTTSFRATECLRARWLSDIATLTSKGQMLPFTWFAPAKLVDINMLPPSQSRQLVVWLAFLGRGIM